MSKKHKRKDKTEKGKGRNKYKKFSKIDKIK